MHENLHKGLIVTCFVALLLTGVPLGSQTPRSSTDLQQVALSLLRNQLRSNSLSTSSNFIDRIAEETGRSSTRVIASTQSLLDTLDLHRRTESPTWLHLTVASSGKATSAHASQFLSNLIAAAKKTIGSERISEVHEQSYGKIPQYTLIVRLTQFELKRMASKGDAFYAPSVEGKLILSPGSFDYEILNEPFTILCLRSGRNIHDDDDAMTDFSPFYVDIAGEIREILEKHLSKAD